MSGWEILVGVVIGLLVNEFGEVSPWAARKLVHLSARIRYGTSELSVVRAEELTALINDRPGKLFKLATASGLLFSAAVARASGVRLPIPGWRFATAFALTAICFGVGTDNVPANYLWTPSTRIHEVIVSLGTPLPDEHTD